MVVNLRSIAIAAAAVFGFAAAQNPAAASTCTTNMIAYQASGVFGSTPISGTDFFKLAGQPFSLTLYACEALKPIKTGPDYAEYYPVELIGGGKSGGLSQPYQTKTKTTFILVQPSTGLDSIGMQGTATVNGISIAIKGDVALPAGTLTSTSIAPFPKVTVVTARSRFTYSLPFPAWQPSTTYAYDAEVVDPAGSRQLVVTAGTSGATSPTWNETLGGTTNDGSVVWRCQENFRTSLSVAGTADGSIYTPPTSKASPLLYTDAVQVITAHAGGTQSVRSLAGAPLDPAATLDRTMLRFYASGVGGASEVHVRIAGQEVRVVYAGASDQFPGLDEVVAEVPRTLAGFGAVDVTMTVDGETASPVRIHIQ
jgi:hypothetical protein